MNAAVQRVEPLARPSTVACGAPENGAQHREQVLDLRVAAAAERGTEAIEERAFSLGPHLRRNLFHGDSATERASVAVISIRARQSIRGPMRQLMSRDRAA